MKTLNTIYKIKKKFRKEGSQVRGLGIQGRTQWWVPWVFFLASCIPDLESWRSGNLKWSMSVDKKCSQNKTCTLKPKDQERNSLARQKLLDNNSCIPPKLWASLHPYQQRRMGTVYFHSCWSSSTKFPSGGVVSGRLSRDLGLLPHLGVRRHFHYPLVWHEMSTGPIPWCDWHKRMTTVHQLWGHLLPFSWCSVEVKGVNKEAPCLWSPMKYQWAPSKEPELSTFTSSNKDHSSSSGVNESQVGNLDFPLLTW